MIINRALLAAGLLCAVLLAPAPVMAGSSPEPPSSDQLAAALLVPEDLGPGFAHSADLNRDPLSSTVLLSKACTRAVKGIAPLYRAKFATALENADEWERLNEYIVNGTRSDIATLERAAKVMVRDCDHVSVTRRYAKDSIRKLQVGKLGDSVYAIKIRSGIPGRNLDKDSMIAIDIVIIRVGHTMIALEHTVNVGRPDSALTRSAAETATRRLQKTLEDSPVEIPL
ncbi:hypothetical protein [Microbispora rosea]|uniref:hypothetical protein n=1 Tax=Microbispora rosea TaxID=58117 RepID=UPI003D8AD780